MKLRLKRLLFPILLYSKMLRYGSMTATAQGGGLNLKARCAIVRTAYQSASGSMRLIEDNVALARLEDGHRAATKRGYKKQLKRARRAWEDRLDYLCETLDEDKWDTELPEMPVCLLENGAC